MVLCAWDEKLGWLGREPNNEAIVIHVSRRLIPVRYTLTAADG